MFMIYRCLAKRRGIISVSFLSAFTFIDAATTCSLAAESTPQTTAPILSAQGLNAIASLLSALLWPTVAIVAIGMFRPTLIDFLSRVRKGKVVGIEVELADRLRESEEEATSLGEQYPRGPTEVEVKRSKEVEKLALELDDSGLRQQLSDLASEYERVRASLPPGNERTRKMTAVVAKMRTIGRIAFRYRYKLLASASPGERLLAICGLQIEPDFELINWLVERVRIEKPFVGYQAIWALIRYAESGRAPAFEAELRQALTELSKIDLQRDPGRMDALRQYKQAVENLREHAT